MSQTETKDGQHVFTADQLAAIAAQVRRVILEGCGYGTLTLVWEAGVLRKQLCTEDARFDSGAQTAYTDDNT